MKDAMILKKKLEVRKPTKEEIVPWTRCYSCKNKDELTLVGFEDHGLLLCDDCLRKLSNKIIEYLKGE